PWARGRGPGPRDRLPGGGWGRGSEMSGEPTAGAAPSANGSVVLDASQVAGLTGPAVSRPFVGAAAGGRATETAIGLLDLIGAALGLIVLSPLLLIVAAAVRLDSPGKAIFRQRRLGKGLEPFSVAKFRTMGEGADPGAHRSHVERMIADADREG